MRTEISLAVWQRCPCSSSFQNIRATIHLQATMGLEEQVKCHHKEAKERIQNQVNFAESSVNFYKSVGEINMGRMMKGGIGNRATKYSIWTLFKSLFEQTT